MRDLRDIRHDVHGNATPEGGKFMLHSTAANSIIM